MPYHQVVLSTVSTASGAANDSAARAQDPLPTTHCKIYLVALKEGLARYQRIIIPVTCTRLYGINVKCCYQSLYQCLAALSNRCYIRKITTLCMVSHVATIFA